MATQSDREIELRQTNRGVGGVCVGVVPRVQSKLSRVLHAHRPARSPNPRKCCDEESYGKGSGSYGKVSGSAGEGRHGICRMPGVFARRHDGGPPVEGNLRQESGVA